MISARRGAKEGPGRSNIQFEALWQVHAETAPSPFPFLSAPAWRALRDCPARHGQSGGWRRHDGSMTCHIVIADATMDRGVLRAYASLAWPAWHASQRRYFGVHLPNSPTSATKLHQHLSVIVHSSVCPEHEHEHGALLSSTRGECFFGVPSCSPTLYRACVTLDVAQRPLGLGYAYYRARSA